MSDALAHRGPDGQGAWIDDGVALGHRRLTIVDLNTGQQPMIGDRGAVISFNGEIYNYREIRDVLQARGVRFTTASDTEVLLKSYEVWGTACLERLNGMFAFAIWDPSRRALFLARDRLGKKPLYYYDCPGLFAFASEIKALMAVPEIARSAAIDPEALSDFISLGYILTPKSIFKTIRRLPAAYYALVTPDRGVVEMSSYWNLSGHFQDKFTEASATAERFRELLDDAVRLRLHADVPLGAFLSGGIDSSAVVAAMAAQSTTPIQAFCAGFRESSFDETPFARIVARSLGVTLNTLDGMPANDAELSRLAWHVDEPFADTSLMPTYHLNRETRRHVKVALSGDGGDEVLAGYPTYRADQIYGFYAAVPSSLQAALECLAGLAIRPSYRKLGWDFKLLQFLRSRGLSRRQAHYWWRVIFSDKEKASLLSPEMCEALDNYNPYDAFDRYFDDVAGADFLDQALYVDTKTWLQDDILVKVDRMSMAHGLEVRSPFLDHRLVEFCARLPPSAKMRAGTQKAILKNSMRRDLPAAVLRRSKRGFNAPTRQLGFVELTARNASEFFRPGFRLNPRRDDVTFKSFSLGMLDAWLKIFQQHRCGGGWRPATT